MKMINTGAAALVLGVLANPVLAQAQAPTPRPASSDTATPTKADRNDPNRMQCRKQQLPGIIGRFKKVCKTKAEWDAEEKQAEEEL